MRILTVFFSRADENWIEGTLRYISAGNTETICRKIEKMINTDVFRIEMKQPYSRDYKTCTIQAKQDLKTNARPELICLLEGMEQYDTIILAYPNYWGTIPMPVVPFLLSFDLSDKTILPLCTHEGSGMGSSENDIRKYAPGARLMHGLSIIGSHVKQADALIEAWLKTNGII